MGNRIYWVSCLVAAFSLIFSACAEPKGTGPAPSPSKPSTIAPAITPSLTPEQQLVEAAKKEGSVELWTQSWPDEVDVPLKKAFKAKYPFLDLRTWDSGTAAGGVARLAEESKIGRQSADVFLSAETDIVAARSAQVIQEYDGPAGWPGQPSHKYWVNIAYSTYSAIYNTDLVPASEAPKSYEDLKNPKWRGKALMTSSGRGSPLYTAWIFGKGNLDWGKSESFWRDVVANTKPRVMSGQEPPLALLAAGDVSIFLFGAVASTVLLLQAGAPLGISKLETAPVFGYSVALVKGSPHPNAARLLINFLTSPEGNLIYANGKGIGAYNPEASPKARANAYYKQFGLNMVPVPADIYTDQNTERASAFWSTKDLYK